MISKYSKFLNSKIFESILQVDDNFHELITSIKNPLARKIDYLFDKDVVTTQNFIKPSKEKSDEVSFVNDTQAQRMIKASEDPFTKTGNLAKIGRLVRQLLTSNDVKVTDQEIEGFVNDYKNEWDKKLNPKKSNLQYVSGEDIRKWYLEDRYVRGGGQLNNSCMRYSRCQAYLDIYVNNPDVCQMVILLNDEGDLLARGLFWTLIDGRYLLDRIYSRFDSDVQKIKDFVRETHPNDEVEDYDILNTRCTAKLKIYHFTYYPYMDTMDCLELKTGLLSSEAPSSGRYLKFRSTEGDCESPGYVYSEIMSDYIDENDAIEYNGDYYHIDDCKEDYRGEMVPSDLLIHSELYNGFINKDDAVETKYGLAPSNNIYLVIVDAQGTKEKIPGIFKDDKFVSLGRRERQGISVYTLGILKELSFVDVFGNYYEKKDIRNFMKVYRTGDHGREFRRLTETYVHDGQYGYSFMLYTSVGNESKSPVCFSSNYISGGRKYYTSEVDCKIFDLERDGDGEYINKESYQKAMYYGMSMCNMQKYIEIVENCERITPAKKRKKLSDIDKYHKYFMRNDYTYRRGFERNN